MAHDIQVTVDCADPHSLANWWSEALGWGVEPSDEAFIRRMVAAGATRLHAGRQGPHTWVTLADPEGNELCVSE